MALLYLHIVRQTYDIVDLRSALFWSITDVSGQPIPKCRLEPAILRCVISQKSAGLIYTRLEA